MLAREVHDALEDLVELIRKESEAVSTESAAAIAAIDEELERAFGRKERTIGALYQHRGEHGC